MARCHFGFLFQVSCANDSKLTSEQLCAKPGLKSRCCKDCCPRQLNGHWGRVADFDPEPGLLQALGEGWYFLFGPSVALAFAWAPGAQMLPGSRLRKRLVAAGTQAQAQHCRGHAKGRLEQERECL